MTDTAVAPPESTDPTEPDTTDTTDTTDTIDTTDDAASSPSPTSSSGLKWLLIALVAVALAVGIAVVASTSDDSPPVVDVTVPAGTGSQLAAGDVVEVVPEILRVEPGGAIELENLDSRLHVLGSLRVDAGDSGRLAFSTEGRYVLPTSLRSDGRVTVLVEAPPSGD
jgi:hypothetical protein